MTNAQTVVLRLLSREDNHLYSRYRGVALDGLLAASLVKLSKSPPDQDTTVTLTGAGWAIVDKERLDPATPDRVRRAIGRRKRRQALGAALALFLVTPAAQAQQWQWQWGNQQPNQGWVVQAPCPACQPQPYGYGQQYYQPQPYGYGQQQYYQQYQQYQPQHGQQYQAQPYYQPPPETYYQQYRQGGSAGCVYGCSDQGDGNE